MASHCGNCKNLVRQNKRLEAEIQELKSKLEYYEKNATLEPEITAKLSLRRLTQRLSDTLAELKIDRSEQKTTLRQYASDYEKSKENLRKAGVQLSNQNFTQKLQSYYKVCDVNNIKLKEIFKKLYEVDNASKSKLQQLHDDTLKISSEITEFVLKQDDILNHIDRKLFSKIMDEENELYESVVKTAQEEILLFNNLEDVCKNNNVSSDRNDKETKANQTNAGVHSVIMENFPESESEKEDMSKVKLFLLRLNYNKECLVKAKRLETSRSGIRPLKVTFSDSLIVDRLIELPTDKSLFRGDYVRISKAKND